MEQTKHRVVWLVGCLLSGLLHMLASLLVAGRFLAAQLRRYMLNGGNP